MTLLPASIRNVVLCDFDGTITVQDTAEWILDKYANGDWRELDDCYVRGKISLLDCMRDQFSMVTTDKSTIVAELDKDITLREGFPELVDICLRNRTKVQIVSAGLDFVIEHFLKKLKVESKVSTYSAMTFDDNGHISFHFPKLTMPEAKTFKDDLVLQYHKLGYQVSYFGDGMPDTEACSISDHRFTIKGRRLEAELAKKGLPFHSFERFSDIIPTLEKILDKEQ